jgi:hypothetical protein
MSQKIISYVLTNTNENQTNNPVIFLDIEECIANLDDYLDIYIDEVKDHPTAIDTFYNDICTSIESDDLICTSNNPLQEGFVRMAGWKDDYPAPTIYYTIRRIDVELF